MNQKPNRCIDILKPFESRLSETAVICLTIKMPDRKLVRKVDDVVSYFKSQFLGFDVVRVMYLLSNSNSERCLVARRSRGV